MSGHDADQADLITSIEKYLVEGTFGDGKAIAGTAAGYYRGVGRLCSEAVGLDPVLVAPVDIPQLESQRRDALDDALREGMAGRLDQVGRALRNYLELRTRALADPDLLKDRITFRDAPEPRFPQAGSGHWFGELLLGRLAETTELVDADRMALGGTVTESVEAARSRAVALARRSLPRLAGDIFRAVPAVILYRARQPYSTYLNDAPLLIFVAEEMFERDHVAAELMIHECLHQKLNDISVTRALFRAGYDDNDSARISVPWSFGSGRVRHFSADRSFAAYHVYTHQTLFYMGMLATARLPEENERALDNLVLSWARAAHFTHELAGGPIVDELGPDGPRFVGWLTRAVDDLGTYRLPDGSLLSTRTGAVNPS
jgi:hypothetical protein